MNENYLPVKNKSVYTEALMTSLGNIPEEYHEMSEDKLREQFNPTLKMYEIKQKFWIELTAASTSDRKMSMTNVYEGVVSKEYFYRCVLKDTKKMAWVIHPLTTYENRVDAALQRATERYEDLVNMDISVTKKRKVDGEWVEYQDICPKKAGILLSTIKQLEDRKLGVAVQRQINVNQTEKTVKAEPVDGEKIDDRLKEIEQKLGSMGDIVDV